MSDELQNGVPGVPAGTEPGQPAPTTEEQQQAPAAPQIDLSAINLDDLPQYRTVKSELQSQAGKAQREAEMMRREAALAKQREQQVLNAIKQYDPKMAESVESQLAAQAVHAERDFYKQQYEVTQWQQQATTWAIEAGLDVKSADVQRALANLDDGALANMAEERRFNERIEQALRARGIDPSAPPTVAAAPAQPTTITQPSQPAAQRPSVGALPPSGGSSPSSLDALYDQKAKYQNEPSKYAKELEAINREIKQRSGQ